MSAAAIALVLGATALALAAFASDLSARVALPLAGAAWVLALVAAGKMMR